LSKDKPQITIAAANNVYELRNTGALVNYFHNAMFSPAKSALIKAVKQGHLATWPGLTEDAINKHLNMTLVKSMDRMNQKRKNICSTSKEMQVASDLEYEVVTPFGTVK
jgi:hypothetical protein